MEKCPNCGYKIGVRWPFVLTQLAFVVLYFSSEFGELKNHRGILDVVFLMVLIASIADGVIRWRYDMKSAAGKPGSTI